MQRIREITQIRVHYGYRRVDVLLPREVWPDNHKRVYRLYREERLSLRHKRARRNKAARLRQSCLTANAINEVWSMDFVAYALFDGRRLHMLTVVDNFTRGAWLSRSARIFGAVHLVWRRRMCSSTVAVVVPLQRAAATSCK